jgi:UDP-N-acetyl-2-amino-2-deoxyglucuronate dehydrogenase
MKRFALIGAAGYIAPKHMQAIKETGNVLVAALDKHDSVGVLDSYFPEADFFLEFERFDRHLEKLKREGNGIDYLVVCSPNYLHDAHIRFGLRLGADVICEKPVVLNPWNVDALMEMENETGKRVFTILQLRLHPSVVALREKIIKSESTKKHHVRFEYITPRGRWYHISWKGDIHKSGGITSNIGVHVFDILLWVFGKVEDVKVEQQTRETVCGHLTLEKANVSWLLSIDGSMLPEENRHRGDNGLRSLSVDNEKYDLTKSTDSLHTKSYRDILNGNGFSLRESRELTELLSTIRNL